MKYTDSTLQFLPYGQARARVFENGTIQLISYNTIVCEIDTDKYLSCTGTYSQTTRKHIGKFLKQFAPQLNYYDAKNAFLNHYKINIDNGDIIDL